MKKMFILCLISVLFFACEPSAKYIKRVQSLEEGVSNPTTIEELKVAIKKYENRVEDVVAAESQIGIWYKILGSRYLDKKMYGEALKSFEKAIEIYPTNSNLYYYVGVCAGYMAKASLDYDARGSNTQRMNYLKLAENAYIRAIELEPLYARALYGLGVLYVFELNENQKAIPLLEKLLEIEKNHFDGMMVLARAYYSLYEFDKAVNLYDKIIEKTTSSEKKAEAEVNKKIVLDTIYEMQ
ncbi:MAG: tetratricopeptide repeat protein [Spirochaetaceae bacterium]|nr:tetratricopeptide repeat protein [Spirochaetaceae bacterium]